MGSTRLGSGAAYACDGDIVSARPRTAKLQRSNLRAKFDAVYDKSIVGGGFFECDDYYRNDKERYWRSLEFLMQLGLPEGARMLEIGGGQLALLCAELFGFHCTVGDISHEFSSPLRKAGVAHVTFNLLDSNPAELGEPYDVIVLLEVIEHIPSPAHAIFERIKPLLKPDGILFLTTPNLFRLRNLIRMFLGREFLDRFTTPAPGQGLGHQLEYSADHLRWQIEQAGMDVAMLVHSSLGRKGHSTKARLARSLLAPLDIRPKWRDGLVAAARMRKAS